jgi:hypothetical protein
MRIALSVFSLLSWALVSVACAVPEPFVSSEETAPERGALAAQPAEGETSSDDNDADPPASLTGGLAPAPVRFEARAPYPPALLVMRMDDRTRPGPAWDNTVAGTQASCISPLGCPEERTLGLFGSANRGYRREAIELSNPQARAYVTTDVPLAGRQCLTFGDKTQIALGDAFTFSAWFMLRTMPRPGYQFIVSRYDARTARTFGFGLQTRKTGGQSVLYPVFVKAEPGAPAGDDTVVRGSKLWDADTQGPQLGRFHHLVFRARPDGALLRWSFHIDGSAQSSGVMPKGFLPSSVPTHIGCAAYGTTPSAVVTPAMSDPYWSFDGKLDEVIVYNGTLSDAQITSTYASAKPTETPIGLFANTPRDENDRVRVPALLSRLRELGADHYSYEVKRRAHLSDLREILTAIALRAQAGNADAAFWAKFRVNVDSRTVVYGALRDDLPGYAKELVEIAQKHAPYFEGLNLDDFFTVDKATGTSFGDMGKLKPLCDAAGAQLKISATVYCNYPFTSTLPNYQPGGAQGWTKNKPTVDHLAFVEYVKYLRSAYERGKYGSCLGGITLYTSPESMLGKPSDATYVDANAGMINECMRQMRELKLPIREGIYTSSLGARPLSEVERRANLDVARRTHPDAFEAFHLPVDPSTGAPNSPLFAALAEANADPSHIIRW